MTLSVIGAGLGRTGTLSLKAALERLGFGPCYHMIEVIRQPEHIDVWSRAADGETPDWDRLFHGYHATVDWPACDFYQPIAARYPLARVILTVREPEAWYRSATDTIFAMIRNPPPDPVMQAQAAMARKLVVRNRFAGRLDDREHALAVFARHNEEVRRTIPADRLLVYEVAQGWEPLCRFLGCPAPAEPFPRLNTTEDFRQMAAAMAAGGGLPGHDVKRG